MNDLRYTTFEEIIKNVLNEEELDARSAARLIPIAVRGYHEIYKTAMADMKTVYLTFDNIALKTINYPVDYDYYSKVGMFVTSCNGTKRLITLSINRRLRKVTDEDVTAALCDCDSTGNANSDTESVCNGLMPFSNQYTFRNVMRGGQFVGEVFGLGGGESYKGSFNYDDYNCRFSFSGEVPSDAIIVLEYKPNPLIARGNTKIPRKGQEVIIAWVKWRMLNRRNSNINEREEARQLYLAAHEALSDYEDSMTGSELKDMIYEHASFIKY